MGLDQNLERISKISKELQTELSNGVIKRKRYHELQNSLMFCEKDDLSNGFDESLIDYAVPCKAEVEYINVKKAFEDVYGKDVDFNSLHIMGRSWGDSISYCFSDGDKNYKLTITEDDIKNKYLYIQTDDVYAFNVNHELAYWRKAYHLAYYMQNTFGYNGNCYYMSISKDNTIQIIKELKELYENVDNKDLWDKFNINPEDVKNEYFMSDLEYTIKCFEDALDSVDFDHEALCYFEWF